MNRRNVSYAPASLMPRLMVEYLMFWLRISTLLSSHLYGS